MSRTPPVPESQQSPIIRGEHSPPDVKSEVKHDPAGGDANLNMKEQGEPGNRHQNLTHQGYQQDR